MKRTPVNSSNLASVGYDPLSQALEIEFLNGGVYQYYDVPLTVFESLMSASSHGTYFDKNIKKAGYRYKKM
jgi:hypothetical protein